jgi:hypothetical protein
LNNLESSEYKLKAKEHTPYEMYGLENNLDIRTLEKGKLLKSETQIFKKMKLMHDYKMSRILSVVEKNYQGDQNYLEEYFSLE